MTRLLVLTMSALAVALLSIACPPPFPKAPMHTSPTASGNGANTQLLAGPIGCCKK
jgi:hypothetical protein